jgi:hypothetical protein
MSEGAKVAIIVVVIIVVIVVGGFTAAVLPAIQRSASQLNAPNVNVTNGHAYGTENCGLLGDQTTSWSFTATLVNTGGQGYADVNFEINGAIVTSNTYFVGAQSSLPISDAVTLHVCQVPSTSNFNIVLASQRSA